MSKNTLLFGALLLGAAGLYLYTKPTPPPGYNGYNYIPPGGTYNGFYNNTGQPAWLGVTNGVLQVVNTIGQGLASIPWSQFAGNGGNVNWSDVATGAGSGAVYY